MQDLNTPLLRDYFAAAPTSKAHEKNVLRSPCASEAHYLARRTLRDPLATPAAQASATDTLAKSTDWSDIDLVRRFREHSRAIQRQHDAERKLAAQSLAVPIEPAALRKKPTPPPKVDVLALCTAALLTAVLLSAAVTTISAGTVQVAQWRAMR